jgi:hypothetical protein
MAAGQPRLQDASVRNAQRGGCPAEADVRTRSGDVMRQDACGEGIPTVGRHIIPVAHNRASATTLSAGDPLRRADCGFVRSRLVASGQRNGLSKGRPTPQRRASNPQ